MDTSTEQGNTALQYIGDTQVRPFTERTDRGAWTASVQIGDKIERDPTPYLSEAAAASVAKSVLARRQWAHEHGIEVVPSQRSDRYSGSIVYADNHAVIQRTDDGHVEHKRIAVADTDKVLKINNPVIIDYKYGSVAVAKMDSKQIEKSAPEKQTEHTKARGFEFER